MRDDTKNGCVADHSTSRTWRKTVSLLMIFLGALLRSINRTDHELTVSEWETSVIKRRRSGDFKRDTTYKLELEKVSSK